jgi:hypothetical protein
MAALDHGLQLLVCRFLQGRLAELEPAYASLATAFDRVGEAPPWRHAVRAGHALLLADTGREAAARAALDRLAANGFDDVPRDGSWIATLALAGHASLALGDEAAATRLYDLLTPYAERIAVLGGAIVSFGSVAALLGTLAQLAGQSGEAARLLEEGLEHNAAAGHRPFEAWTAARYAALLRERGGPGDSERANALSGHAREIAAATGMRDLAAEQPAAPAVSTPAAAPQLSREGEYWTLAYEGSVSRLKHTKGLDYIARLLADPNVEISAADLIAGERGPAPAGAAAAVAAGELGARPAGDEHAGELLDAQAKAAYRQRLAELREELDEAEAWSDPERAATAREEMDFLARELERAVGLGGRDRKAASAGERARVNTTRAIKTATARIAEHDARLADYLAATIRTGTFCSYSPERAAGRR